MIKKYSFIGKARASFTLIEMILYIGMSAIIIVALLRVMITITTTREKAQTVSSVQQELRFVMDRITASARNAVDINIAGSTFGSDNGVLSLSMSGASLNPTVFTLTANRITVKEGLAAAQSLTSSGVLIDRLRFANLSANGTNGTVKVTIHGTDAVAGSADPTYTDTFTLETSVSLRQ